MTAFMAADARGDNRLRQAKDEDNPIAVTPAKAGVQADFDPRKFSVSAWMPAFAGMTKEG
jgi:hypothetical protein